ncbi:MULTISPECIES: OsmC family protein [unclassified Neptuniibacter]|uniref:OsmC family protein n=1 Tax=unclassified Neptuniibacter TaxID=2630693 RepID=UPI0026E1A4EF|nr:MULTISPECIES: OsmC family protein [unclassified Neptuniibacter]MDO6512980.1 OsmC family protein [Neptuniibacter sp. 2_MG-2023]MDO6592825.1 OsmC family protein [Neptuniibacter sp. 1_MG-2023]
MSMSAKVKWDGDVRFKGTTGSGFDVMIDGELQQGPRPMELILLGLGGCTSYDVVGILKKTRQDVIDCVAEIEAERAETVPSVFTKIHVKFVVSGRGLNAKKVERAVSLSAEQYCSASIMLEKGGVEITHSFEIVEVTE